MKVIIAGSRTIHSYPALEAAIAASGFDIGPVCEECMAGAAQFTCEVCTFTGRMPGIDEVVSGGASGVDALGEEWAFRNQRKLRIFPADWTKFGRSAGARRNIQMADYIEDAGGGGLIALWRNNSPGTGHMIQVARERALKVYIHNVSNE